MAEIFQTTTANVVGESIKRFLSRHVHWWFAYNEISAKAVLATGFPDARITRVQNAIDTTRLSNALRNLDGRRIDQIKSELALSGTNVCVYAGGMYAEKRIDFLLEACDHIRELVPDFEMVFIGAGEEAFKIEEAAARRPWIKYVGPQFNEAKVPYFAMAKLFLMPGLVGLAVLDAFALEVPLVTTDIEYHSPEIEYLDNGVNGLILPDTSPSEYADAVARLLADSERLNRLVEGCKEARKRYSNEEMVRRFSSGVLQALDLEPHNATE